MTSQRTNSVTVSTYISLLQLLVLFSHHASAQRNACPQRCVCSPADDVSTTSSFTYVTCDGVDLTEIPRSVPSTVTSLEFRRNSLVRLGSGALDGAGRSLMNLDLRTNEIETIADGAFKATPALQTLDLSGNNLTEVGQYTFAGAEMLLHLDLSSNRLEGVDGAFTRLRDLSKLDLRSNLLTALTQNTFKDLTSLRYLQLADNRVEQIDRRAFRSLEKLTQLVLKGNPLGEVSRFSFASLVLSFVDLSECGLARVPRGLPNSIRYLQLRRNNMTSLPADALQDCRHVSIVVLDENSLSKIDERAFDDMPNLQQLWLNYNRLETVPRRLPPSLLRLLLESNRIRDVTDAFPPSCGRLETLSLATNSIYELRPDVLVNLGELKTLDLSQNQLRRLYGQIFRNNTRLKSLELSRNPLEFFYSRCLHGLRALRRLSLAYVTAPSPDLHPDAFRDLGALARFDLDHSPGLVRAWLAADELLGSLGGLKELSLFGSNLVTLREDFVKFFPGLAVIHIQSTRWHCDASLAWFRTWCVTTTVDVVNVEENLCLSPPPLSGRAIVHLSDRDFNPLTLSLPKKPPVSPPGGRTVDGVGGGAGGGGDGGEHDVLRSAVTRVPTRATSARYAGDFIDFNSAYDSVNHYGHDAYGDKESENDDALDNESQVRADDSMILRFTTDIWSRVSSNDPQKTTVSDQKRSTHILDEILPPAITTKPHESEFENRKSNTRASTARFDVRISGDERNNNFYSRMRTPISSSSTPAARIGRDDKTRAVGGDTSSSNNSVWLIAVTVATIFITLFVVIFMIIIIIKLTRNNNDRKRRKQGRLASSPKTTSSMASSSGSRGGEPSTPGGIVYNHKSNVLYFIPKTSSDDARLSNGGAAILVGTNGHGGPSLSSDELSRESSKEGMSLIPGRDINHEGPMRVYKWTDF